MVKMKASNDQKPPLELLVSNDDAAKKIVDRVDKGNEIKQVQIQDENSFDETKNLFDSWHKYNIELLKRIFTNDELSAEYKRWTGPIGPVRLREPTLREKANEFHKEIDKHIHKLESIIERLELIPLSNDYQQNMEQEFKTQVRDKSKIFVVHGQNNEAKLEVARFIEKIGFEPIILHEQISGSKTIIEKIETYSDVGFGVVIYTPCDVGAKASEVNNLKGRARQNVVFEHGFLIGKLGRPNVCSLVKGDLETPNDISGIVYTSMDQVNWQLELAKELKAAGYPVDMNRVI